MAEAEVATSNASKFFCHRCTAEISPKLPDYVCPRCNSGFIEILEQAQDSDSDSESSTEMDFEFLDVLAGNHSNAQQGNSDSTASPAGGGGTGPASSSLSWPGPRRGQRFRNTINPRHGRRRFGHDQRQQALSPILQEVIMQMTSSMLGGPGVGAELGLFSDGVELPGIPMILASNLASNPGDYAWGRGGLDAIITQLMNQLDGTGPPPLPQEKINLIPSVKISQDQCDKSLQCPVCMEDFDLDELVRKLNCEHCYHEDCIIPWLQLHGTCPVCRKALLGDLGGESENVHFHSFGLGESSNESMERGDNRVPDATSNSSRSSNSFNSSNPRLNFMEEDLD